MSVFKAYRGRENGLVSLSPIIQVLADDFEAAEVRVAEQLNMNRGRHMYLDIWNAGGRLLGRCVGPNEAPYVLKFMR